MLLHTPHHFEPSSSFSSSSAISYSSTCNYFAATVPLHQRETMMAPSFTSYSKGLIKVAVTVILISSLTILPPKSVGLEWSSHSKMVLGSRPPGCVNKCKSCRPCKAILVIPPHVIENNNKGFRESSPSSHREDDYYLLSWRCRCGNKLYQP